MNVGILGANGFVGSNLASRLAAFGLKVRTYGRSEVDLVNPQSLARIADHDVVINCAAYVGSDRDRLFLVNVQGVQNLCAELGSRAVVPYLVQLSSGAVYGYSDVPAVSDSPPAPQGDYASSKYLGDEIVRLNYPGPSLIARLYFPYGLGQARERLMPRLVGRVLSREPIDVSVHDSRPLINPIYIDDLCEELHRLVRGRIEGVSLIGGGEIVSVRDIANLVSRVTGVEPIFRQVDGATSSMYCDGKSCTKLDQGLRRVIKSICNA